LERVPEVGNIGGSAFKELENFCGYRCEGMTVYPAAVNGAAYFGAAAGEKYAVVPECSCCAACAQSVLFTYCGCTCHRRATGGCTKHPPKLLILNRSEVPTSAGDNPTGSCLAGLLPPLRWRHLSGRRVRADRLVKEKAQISHVVRLLAAYRTLAAHRQT
jgi:hypothetical protein